MPKPRLTLKRVAVLDSTPEPPVVTKKKRGEIELEWRSSSVPFDQLAEFLSKGSTNMVVLDLHGDESPVKADAIRGTVEEPKKRRRRKATKFEKALAKFLAKHDIEFEDDAIVQLALVAHSWAAPATRS